MKQQPKFDYHAPNSIESLMWSLDDIYRKAWAASESGDHARALEYIGLVSFTATRITRTMVEDARAGGLSWSQIGAGLDMTKQAAQQKYSERRSGSASVPGPTGPQLPLG